MRVGIAGTTTWGTTLGILLAHKGAEVALWARSQDEADRINGARCNEARLPGHELPPPCGRRPTPATSPAPNS